MKTQKAKNTKKYKQARKIAIILTIVTMILWVVAITCGVLLVQGVNLQLEWLYGSLLLGILGVMVSVAVWREAARLKSGQKIVMDKRYLSAQRRAQRVQRDASVGNKTKASRTSGADIVTKKIKTPKVSTRISSLAMFRAKILIFVGLSIVFIVGLILAMVNGVNWTVELGWSWYGLFAVRVGLLFGSIVWVMLAFMEWRELTTLTMSSQQAKRRIKELREKRARKALVLQTISFVIWTVMWVVVCFFYLFARGSSFGLVIALVFWSVAMPAMCVVLIFGVLALALAIMSKSKETIRTVLLKKAIVVGEAVVVELISLAPSFLSVLG